MERRPSFAKLKPAARSFTGRYQTHMVLLKENSREGKEPRVVLRPSPTEARPRVLPAAKPRLLSKSYAALDVRPRVLPAGDGPRARPVPAPPPGKPRHGTPIRQAAAAYRKPHDLSSRAVDHADAEPHDSSPPKQLNRGGGWAGGRRLVFDRREALSPPVVAKAKSAVAVGEPPDRILPLAAAKPFVVLSYCKETDGGRGEKRMWQIANFLLRHGIHSFNRLQGAARPSAPGSDRSREWRSKLQAAGVCIALVGPKYFASSPCNAELQEAIKKGVPILPICFDTQRVQEQSRFEAERLPTLRRTIKTPLEAARTVPLSFVSHAEWRARRENGVFGTEDGQRALGTWLPEHGRFQDDWEAHLKTLLAMVTGHLRRAREKAEEALHIAATGMTEEEKAAAERAAALLEEQRAAAERRRRHPAVAAAERAAAAKAAAEEAAAAARAEREAAAAEAAAAAAEAAAEAAARRAAEEEAAAADEEARQKAAAEMAAEAAAAEQAAAAEAAVVEEAKRKGSLVSALAATDDKDLSSLHLAAKRGQAGVIRALVAAGAPVDERAAGSLATPLMIAVVHNETAAVEVLLELKADAMLKADGGSTAANFARGEIRRLLDAAHRD